MKINFLVNPVFDGWKPDDVRLGGTEESVVRWAQELEKRGHKVTIYDNDTRDRYKGGGDICINVKSYDIAPKEPTLYFTNETDATKHDLSLYDGVIWPSQWAADNIEVNNKNLFILPHGYDPTHIFPDTKIPKQCFYASSPDRGLDTLLEAWPTVYENHPDATLVLTYGGHSELPGIISLGEVDELTMDEIYNSSDIWCHPNPTHELYCMTGKKAQVSGCIPVITPAWALSETVKRGFKTTPENYAQTLIEVLGMDMKHRDIIRKDIIANANAHTWEQSTDILLEIINSVAMTP